MSISDVKRNDSLRPSLAQVNLKRFLREQVNGNSVSGERIHHQNIEGLGLIALQFGFHRNASVTGNHFETGLAVLQIGKQSFVVGNPYHLRINLIKTEMVSWFAVGSERSNAQTDHTDTQGVGSGQK